MWILFKLAEALTHVYAEIPCARKRGNRLIDLHCWDGFCETTKKVRLTFFISIITVRSTLPELTLSHSLISGQLQKNEDQLWY